MVATVFVFSFIGLAFVFMGIHLAIIANGKDCETSTHVVEVYHGNWWATWHTSFQIKMINCSVVMSFVAIIIAIVTGLIL